MMSLGDLIVGIELLVPVVSVSIARRAKPLGPHRYRWGTYVGLVTTAVGVGMVLLTFIQLDALSGFLFGVLSGSLLGAGVGLLCRRRFGVIALLAAPLVWALVAGTHPAVAPAGVAWNTLAGGSILTLPNVPYFWKRWQAMAAVGAGKFSVV